MTDAYKETYVTEVGLLRLMIRTRQMHHESDQPADAELAYTYQLQTFSQFVLHLIYCIRYAFAVCLMM